MFTNRYIKVPVELYDTKQTDMLGFNDETRTEGTDMYILPFEISHYRASVDDNDELLNTLIHMKNGDSFHVSLTVQEFEKVLNAV